MNSRLLPRLSQRCRNSGVLKASIQRHLSPLSTCQPRNRATAHAEQDFTPSGVRPPPVRRDAPALRRSQARAFSDHHLVQLSIDGRDIPFSSLFLRDSCQCTACVDEHSGQKRFETASIPADIAVTQVNQDADGNVTLVWNRDFMPNHKSTTFDIEWLRNASRPPSPTDVASTSHRNVRLWNGNEFSKEGLNFIPYPAFLNGDALDHAVTELMKWGLIFIDGVPEDEESVANIAEKIGPLKNTFYGRTWDVRDKPKAENVAYTSHHLGLHMDLLYMKYPPGIQLLHCLKASCKGGESMFSDAFRSAAQLYAEDPAAFHDLATFPVTYRYNKGGHYYSDTKPTFEIDHSQPPDPTTRIPCLANINWSPPFQGPFVLDRGTKDAGQALAAYHRAAKLFTTLVNSSTNEFSYLLQPGQCVIFNNRRVLHGRQKFQSGSGERWLKGAYLDMDDFTSKLKAAEVRRDGDGLSLAH